MEKPTPFISYAREDIDWARKIASSLKKIGAQPWIDEEELLPGQDWKSHILRALKSCSHVIVLISKNSVNKRGFVQKEVKKSLELLDEFPPDSIFLLPVRLDKSEPKYLSLSKLNWIDIYDEYDRALTKIAAAMGLIYQKETISINWKRNTKSWSSYEWMPVIEDRILHLLTNKEITRRLRFSELDFYFYPNGKIQSARLKDSQDIYGMSFDMGDTIYFDEDGRIVGVHAYRGGD